MTSIGAGFLGEPLAMTAAEYRHRRLFDSPPSRRDLATDVWSASTLVALAQMDRIYERPLERSMESHGACGVHPVAAHPSCIHSSPGDPSKTLLRSECGGFSRDELRGRGCDIPGAHDDESDERDSRALEAMLAQSTLRPACIIFPTDAWKGNWDIGMLVAVLYSGVSVPIHFCFQALPSGAWWACDLLTSLLFLLDWLFNFNTAFIEPGTDSWQTSRSRIAAEYLRGWFWIDTPASVPFELVDLLINDDTENEAIQNLRVLRMMRLLRLLRLLRIGYYIGVIELKFGANVAGLKIVTLVLNLVYMAHLVACAWFFSAHRNSLAGIPTWLSEYEDGTVLMKPISEQYLVAFFWSVGILTGGGSNVEPANGQERNFCILANFLAALISGYILGSIVSLVASMNRRSAAMEEMIDSISAYSRWRDLPKEIMLRLRRHYEFQNATAPVDEQFILNGLTPSLRSDVIRHVLRHNVSRIPLFSSVHDPAFLTELFPMLRFIAFNARDTIYKKGETSLELYILVKGRVFALSPVDGKNVDYVLSAGDHFGESALTGLRRGETAVAASYSEMYMLTREEFETLYDKHPRSGLRVRNAVLKQYRKREAERSWKLRVVLSTLKPGTPGHAALFIQNIWHRFCYRMSRSEIKIARQPLADGAVASSSCDHRRNGFTSPPLLRRSSSRQMGIGRAPSVQGELPSSVSHDAGRFEKLEQQVIEIGKQQLQLAEGFEMLRSQILAGAGCSHTVTPALSAPPPTTQQGSGAVQ